MPTSSAERLARISIEDYLAGEADARQRHEYVDGLVYAMVGAKYRHNLITANIVAELHSQLKGTPCRALSTDMKVRTETSSKTSFYYPDVLVVCGDKILDGVYQDQPTVVVEVLSDSTRRIDEGEKKDAYLTIDSLGAYILLEQDTPAATVYHRQGNTFDRRIYDGIDSVVELPAIKAALPLAGAYAEVIFPQDRATD